jgi:hypothetical protein
MTRPFGRGYGTGKRELLPFERDRAAIPEEEISMPKRNWLSTGGKLGSLAALGAGVVSLTTGKAEAADIIVSGILNSTIGFSSNTVIRVR